jgi:hypothetical protein
MQKLLFLLTGISVFISCTKNTLQTSDQSQEPSTLVSITGDSADFSFIYEDGRVTDVMARHNDGGNYFGDSSYAPYAHLSYDSANYVKATNTDPRSGYAYTEYFLNENKLPLKIIIHFKYGIDVVDFFYNPQTNFLDSIHDTNDSIYFTRAYMQYDGEDIASITILETFLNGTIEKNIEYRYDKTTPNVFKTPDPLWYIYYMPFGTYNTQSSWIQMNHEDITRLFSQSTFTQIRSYYSLYNAYWDTLHYTLNSTGSLETEWYSLSPDHIRYYNYSN